MHSLETLQLASPEPETEAPFCRWLLRANGVVRLLCIFTIVVGLCFPLCAEVGVGQSGSFTVNTRWSGGVGESVSGAFTVDTTGAALRNATVAGLVRDTTGRALAGAAVIALQNNLVRRQTTTDAAGRYALDTLTAGSYLLRVEKANYLTALRYDVALPAGQTMSQDFALAGTPPAPTVTPTTRLPQSTSVVPIISSQLKAYVNGGFVANGTVDRSKMTVVLTHGWLSNPNEWAKGMAAAIGPASAGSANLLTWDWQAAAGTGPTLSLAFTRAPGQGEGLGQALLVALGTSYKQPIHFIGHSLGTLVNAAAADYLHAQQGGIFDPAKTHVTLLDEAEAANIDPGRISVAGYVVTGLEPLAGQAAAPVLGWVSPLPRKPVAWVDNYISLVGQLHTEAVNVLLAQAPARAASAGDIAGMHSYATKWYSLSVAAVGTPQQSALGFRYSFERMGPSAAFPSPSPYPLGTVFVQDAGTPELDLLQLLPGDAAVEKVLKNFQFPALILQRGLNDTVGWTVDKAEKIGNAVINVAEAFVPTVPVGTPVFTGTAGSTTAYFSSDPIQATPIWSLQIQLQTAPVSPSQVQGASVQKLGGPGAGSPTNQTACVWIPVSVPPNAMVFSFDFTFTGEPAKDLLLASVDGTNVFQLEARFTSPDTRLNSGSIDISRWAGRTVEFFFGLVGGTTTNTTVTVDALRFYQMANPALSAELVGKQVVISWPATAGGFTLESATELMSIAPWSTVTNVPVTIGSFNVVTNNLSGQHRFYRLRK